MPTVPFKTFCVVEIRCVPSRLILKRNLYVDIDAKIIYVSFV